MNSILSQQTAPCSTQDEKGTLLYPACNGQKQSPIDIPLSSATLTSRKIGDYRTSPNNGVALSISQSHGSPKFSCTGSTGSCGTIVWGGKTYSFSQLHFHSPSENKIDGMSYPLSMHMVHHNADTNACRFSCSCLGSLAHVYLTPSFLTYIIPYRRCSLRQLRVRQSQWTQA